MKKYIVEVEWSQLVFFSCEVEVEAKDIYEAEDKAENKVYNEIDQDDYETYRNEIEIDVITILDEIEDEKDD